LEYLEGCQPIKKRAFGKITKTVSKLRKGKKAKTTVERQISKALGKSLKDTVKKYKAEKKKSKIRRLV